MLVGDGSDRGRIEKLVESLNLGDRVSILGAVPEDELLALYKGALAVLYTPYDEDFGYVTLEAFLAQKPLVTVTDAGGPLEFVEDGVNGYVCEPTPEAVAAALNRLAADRPRAARLGLAGYERARLITWDSVIEALVPGYRP